MEADEQNTLMILSPVWTPARIAAPSGKHKGGKKSIKEPEERKWYTTTGKEGKHKQYIFMVQLQVFPCNEYAINLWQCRCHKVTISRAILKDHNSGYITRRTCFTAPPQTKGFKHETGYYKRQVWLKSAECSSSTLQTINRFCVFRFVVVRICNLGSLNEGHKLVCSNRRGKNRTCNFWRNGLFICDDTWMWSVSVSPR